MVRGLRLGRYVAIAAIAGCLVMLVGPAPAAAPRFVVGFDDDLAKQPGTPVAPALRQLGATAERITLQWSPGVTTLSSADSAGLDRAVAASSGLRLLLTVYGTSGTAAPVSSTARSQYCAYVSAALRHSPQIRDVVIWNEPNKSQFWSPQLGSGTAPAAPAAYETLLATCYDVLHGSFPTINVLGLALAHNGNDNASGTSPGAFIRNLGTAYRASGRRARLLDTIAYHPYPATNAERPWLQHIGSTTIGEGDWNKLMYNLWQAFNGTAQPIPGTAGVSIWYSEWGVQSAIPAAKAPLYSGTENVPVVPEQAGGDPVSPPPPATSPAPDQATQVLDAVELAACQPSVTAFFNFLIADEPTLAGWQSAPLYVDRSAKASYPAFAQAISAASSGTLDCSKLKGGRPSSDYLPPATPANLTGTVAGTPPIVTLQWQPATDNASPISYRVYRGSSLVTTVTTTSWSGTIAAGSSATYSVRGIDSAGNLGNASNTVTLSG